MYILQQSIKVSLIGVGVEQLIIQPFGHQVLCLTISADNPSETLLTTWTSELFYSYLFGLGRPQTLDRYGTETPGGRRAHETLTIEM